MSRPLIVNEIFRSLQGEGLRMGLPCVLVRLAGCNLRCAWCDTPHALDASAGREMTCEQVLAEVAEYGCPRVELTGGEPLLQAGARETLRRFCDAGLETLLETNGTLDLSDVDERVVRIVDVKCPSSGHAGHTHWPSVERLAGRDELKFVLADQADFDYGCEAIDAHALAGLCPITFSPVAGRLEAATLADWILASGRDVRLGLQLHKIIWPGVDRGV